MAPSRPEPQPWNADGCTGAHGRRIVRRGLLEPGDIGVVRSREDVRRRQHSPGYRLCHATGTLGYDNCDCDALLTQLATHGNEDGGLPFITRYAVDGKNFIQINNFSKHQCPHMREQESTIPPPEEGIISTVQAPDKHSASTVQESDKHGTSPSDSPFLNTDSPFLDTQTSCSGETDTVRLDKLSDSQPCPHKEIIDLYHE